MKKKKENEKNIYLKKNNPLLALLWKNRCDQLNRRYNKTNWQTKKKTEKTWLDRWEINSLTNNSVFEHNFNSV